MACSKVCTQRGKMKQTTIYLINSGKIYEPSKCFTKEICIIDLFVLLKVYTRRKRLFLIDCFVIYHQSSKQQIIYLCKKYYRVIQLNSLNATYNRFQECSKQFIQIIHGT